jgi:hypothetical protein
MNTHEIAVLATNLALNCGWHVFPCRDDKRPACPHGFHAASNDPAAIEDLWRRCPGPLIGVATGAVSGADVLDIDVKHDAALAWWHSNRQRIPATRTFRTRSGGVHGYLIHASGVGCSAGKVAPGIDIRGDGGYVICWFAAGFGCLDHSPPARWPAWLLAELLPKPPPGPQRSMPRDRSGHAIDGVLDRIATAAQGSATPCCIGPPVDSASVCGRARSAPAKPRSCLSPRHWPRACRSVRPAQRLVPASGGPHERKR